MFWVGVGAAILALLAVVFHLLQEYFWAVVFYVFATILGTWALVLASNQGMLGP